MATLYASGHSPTQHHMNEVYNAMLKTYAAQRDTNAKYAKDIQDLLTMLKNPAMANTNPEIWKALQNKVASIAGVPRNVLFKQQGGSSQETGAMFEKEMAAVVDTMVQYRWDSIKKRLSSSRSTRRVVNKVSTGMINGYVEVQGKDFGQILEDNPDQKQFLQAISQLEAKERGKYYNLVDANPKQIKTDIMGSNLSAMTATISWETTDKWDYYAKLLSNFNFSVKSYSSLSKSWSDIKLGETNPYKAYAAILGTLGYSEQTIYETYSRAYWCNYHASLGHGDHSSHEAALSISQIQSVFELMGAGVVSQYGSDKADFLIVNDTASGSVQVRSTDAMVYEILTGRSNIKTRTSNPFVNSKITISGHKI